MPFAPSSVPEDDNSCSPYRRKSDKDEDMDLSTSRETRPLDIPNSEENVKELNSLSVDSGYEPVNLHGCLSTSPITVSEYLQNSVFEEEEPGAQPGKVERQRLNTERNSLSQGDVRSHNTLGHFNTAKSGKLIIQPL